MNYYNFDIVLQEVPNEISLCFAISGCPIQCPGCHSPHLWKKNSGSILDTETFVSFLDQYDSLISCVLFMGGEWETEELIPLLQKARERGLKTCLYSGMDDVSTDLKQHLTYLKTGPWIQAKGGLNKPESNQVFREISSNKILNHLFY